MRSLYGKQFSVNEIHSTKITQWKWSRCCCWRTNWKIAHSLNCELCRFFALAFYRMVRLMMISATAKCIFLLICCKMQSRREIKKNINNNNDCMTNAMWRQILFLLLSTAIVHSLPHIHMEACGRSSNSKLLHTQKRSLNYEIISKSFGRNVVVSLGCSFSDR